MTKKKFKEYDKTKDVYCECCKKNKPVSSFAYRDIKTNTRKATRCKTCDWFYRNHNSSIPKIDNFTDIDIYNTVSFMLENKNIYINELAKILDINIESVINLIYKLNLKNITAKVKTTCEYCGKETSTFASVYLKTKNIYCSTECYWKDKPNKIEHGENSQFYNRIKTNCTNCEKMIEKTPYMYNRKNKFGDNHNFCSKECYWKYRSKYYVCEKVTKHEFTDDEKEQSRIRLLERLKKDDRLDTGIQKIINNLLEEHNIKYEREKIFDYYAVDNYILEYNGIIEVMGDYWHASPLKYNENKYFINEMQQKQLHRDKIKYSYIKNHYSIPILYLWEHDINTNPELCISLIKKYIQNNRILKNYHSFNWEYIDNNLSLRENIIVPYQDVPVEKYRHLIKKKVG